MIEPSKQLTWGIIRYAPGSGIVPEDDAAGFDGWYAERADALEVAQWWVSRYPRWIVALVRSDLVWFGDGDFTALKTRALTTRENYFRRRGEN